MGFQQMTLVSRKKQQWQRERDEMAQLKSWYSSSMMLSDGGNNEGATHAGRHSTPKQRKDYDNNFTQEQRYRSRNTSLPPIDHLSISRNNHSEEDSGFTSDGGGGGAGQKPKECSDEKKSFNPNTSSQHLEEPSKPLLSNSNSNTAEKNDTNLNMGESFELRSYSPESISATSFASSKAREERARWNIFDSTYKDVKNQKEFPLWLDKNYREPDDESYSSYSSYSFLRGQNIPIDPTIFAEREIKRKRALEFQKALEFQLKEKENMKKYELQKKLEEERREEDRLMREFEKEQHRLEMEKIQLKLKEEHEKKKAEVMEQALQKAMMQAKLEKDSRRRGRQDSEKVEDKLFDFSEIKVVPSPTNTATVESKDEKPPLNQLEIKPAEPNDETVLIGTPIKMKKKDLKKRSLQYQQTAPNNIYQTEESESDSSSVNNNVRQSNGLDGVTLPVQSIIPIMPVQFANNLLSFAPTNSLANIQFLMIAQPTSIMPPNIHGACQPTEVNVSQQINNKIATQVIKKDEPQLESKAKEQLCHLCNKNHVCGGSEKVVNTPDNQFNEFSDDQKDSDVENSNHLHSIEHKEFSPLPHDRTFTKDEVLEEVTKINDNRRGVSANETKSLTYNKYKEQIISTTFSKSTTISKTSNEIGIQTDLLSNCKFCSASAATRKGHQQYMIERTRSEEDSTTKTIITTVKREYKLERPKWGVRVPTKKYMSQSEKDLFYQRNKHRRRLSQKNRKMSEGTKNEESSSSSCEAPSQTHSSHFSRKKTQLLPIKTNGNGQVYFVHEKSFIIDEALRSKPNQKTPPQEKILNKRERDMDAKINDNNDGYESLDQSQNSSIDYVVN